MMNKVAEVIASTTTSFVAECYELYGLPPLGAMVKTSDGAVEIFGVVCQASTAGIEPGRRPIARGRDEASEQAVYQSSPQLLKLLRSEFNVLVIGHRAGDGLRQYLPPRPAHIHAFVYAAESQEVRRFGKSFGFLNLLVNTATETPPEELIPAVLRQMAAVHDDPRAFLVATGREMTALLARDYQRLRAVLQKLTA